MDITAYLLVGLELEAAVREQVQRHPGQTLAVGGLHVVVGLWVEPQAGVEGQAPLGLRAVAPRLELQDEGTGSLVQLLQEAHHLRA